MNPNAMKDATGALDPLLLRVAAALLVALLVAPSCYEQLRKRWLTRHLPGPSPALPLLGNLLHTLVPQEDLLDLAMDMCARYGPTWRGWVGPHLAISITEPDDLRVAFTDPRCHNKAKGYESIVPLLGQGLFNMDFPAYRRHRKALTPALHIVIVKSLIPRFGSHGRHFMETFERFAESGEVFDGLHAAERVVCRAMCDTVLCSDAEHLEEERDAFRSCITGVSQQVIHVALRPWLRWSDLCFRILSPARHREKQRLSSVLDSFVQRGLERKEEQLSDRKGAEGGRNSTTGPGHRELLEHILTSNEGSLLNREELVSELKHVLSASIETSSDLMALLMLSLATQPHVQRKVQQELDEVFADDPRRPVTFADLPRLQYLDMTVKEVLRFFPLVPVYGRQTSADIKLPSGVLVPRGTMLTVFQKAVHWDPRWYPNPSTFDPDHFLPEAVERRPKFTFIPFAAGSRMCIGHRFAMMFAKTTAATFLREYSFLPSPGSAPTLSSLKLIMGMSVKVKGGIHVRVQRRHCDGKGSEEPQNNL